MIQLYNTATRRKEAFEPVHEGEVRMYVCGPTVYNYIHIGNTRTFLSFDVIRRYLKWRGLKVMFVQNVTDVDDKIINAAAAEGVTAAEIARKYEAAYVEQMEALGVAPPDVAPHATAEIPGMIALVEELIAKGHAYAADGGEDAAPIDGRTGNDVYFDVRSFPGYGSLSGRALDEMRAGERVQVNPLKRDPMDFALWKAAKPSEPWWESPWGPGRPGWHLECSEMSSKYLGIPFDIHGGASDLVFPHHENEKAQSEAAWGGFVKYWIHGGLLNINQEKMSKSLGNFTLLGDVLDNLERATDERGHPRYPMREDRANVVRMLMLGTHYRSPLDYSPDRLDEAASAVERLATAIRNLEWLGTLPGGGDATAEGAALAAATQTARDRFVEAMDDDFNTATALGALFESVRAANAVVAAAGAAGVGSSAREAAAVARAQLLELTGALGLRLAADRQVATAETRTVTSELTGEVVTAMVALARELAGYVGSDNAEAREALLARRAQARAARDWAVSDDIRDRLATIGLAIEDTPQGSRLVARA